MDRFIRKNDVSFGAERLKAQYGIYHCCTHSVQTRFVQPQPEHEHQHSVCCTKYMYIVICIWHWHIGILVHMAHRVFSIVFILFPLSFSLFFPLYICYCQQMNSFSISFVSFFFLHRFISTTVPCSMRLQMMIFIIAIDIESE